MDFDGAVVTEQGVTFGIVIVKAHVLNSSPEEVGVRALGTQAFGPIPIVLMAQDSRGVPTYNGRPDIVRFLSNIFVEQIPWQHYSLSGV
jgi:hypothetical protein